MKKAFLGLFLLAVCFFTACSSKPEIIDTKGLVVELDASRLMDTVHGMKVQTDAEVLSLSLENATLTNGIALKGDSVLVSYIKQKDQSLQALVVTVIPKASKEIILNSDSEASENE